LDTLNTPGTIELRGRVLDRDGAPVPDAMLEFWSSSAAADPLREEEKQRRVPAGFIRVATDSDGAYSIVIEQPAAKRPEASHMIVLVFARGLLRHLITCVYLGDEQANDKDPLLNEISEERRATLIASPDVSRVGLYRWDVRLQGKHETVFFAW
jgi:protocatechuate 3,4-dioxygenase alpha subunit